DFLERCAHQPKRQPPFPALANLVKARGRQIEIVSDNSAQRHGANGISEMRRGRQRAQFAREQGCARPGTFIEAVERARQSARQTGDVNESHVAGGSLRNILHCSLPRENPTPYRRGDRLTCQAQDGSSTRSPPPPGVALRCDRRLNSSTPVVTLTASSRTMIASAP